MYQYDYLLAQIEKLISLLSDILRLKDYSISTAIAKVEDFLSNEKVEDYFICDNILGVSDRIKDVEGWDKKLEIYSDVYFAYYELVNDKDHLQKAILLLEYLVEQKPDCYFMQVMDKLKRLQIIKDENVMS